MDNIQCQHDINLPGDWLVLLSSIEYPSGCRSTNCKKAFVTRAQKKIAEIYYKINLAVKFNNEQMNNVQLIFCSYEEPIPGTVLIVYILKNY